MRVYYLHLNRENFVLSNNNTIWQTGVIDLYANSTYQNYSLVRSNYGLGSIEPMMGGATPNNVWVGMNIETSNTYDHLDAILFTNPSVVYTDSGFIVNDRFIDTSGPINLIGYNVITSEYSSSVTLNLYNTTNFSDQFPSEWVQLATNVSVSSDLNYADVNRYVILQLDWNYDPGAIDLYLRVEIGPPVMMPRYAATTAALAKLPSWMAMSELDNPASATPELDVNSSIGGLITNAMIGEWLDDLTSQVTYRQLQLFIQTADLTQMAWCYRTNIPTIYPYNFIGDGTQCVVAYADSEFYMAQESEDIIFWDENNQVVYSNKLYNNFTINNITYSQEVHQIWNAFDDLGLLVNLYRLPLESNVSFQSRILDVYINQPGAGLRSFQTALRRELNLWQFYGSTPNSYFVGATPDTLEMADLLTDPEYTLPNGMPTPKFVRLVNFLAKTYPTTWGEFLWGAAYADLTDANYTGYTVLPELMDATPWPNAQSGVGDLRDLLVYPPTNDVGPHVFNAQFNIQGLAQQANAFFAPIILDLTLTATGTKTIYNNPPTTVWLTLEFTQYSSATVSYYSFQLTSTSDVNNMHGSTPTSASVASLRVFSADGGTNPEITLFNTTTGKSINSRLFITDISSVSLYAGQWNPSGSNFINIPTYANFIAWFSNLPSHTLTAITNPLVVDNNSATPTLLPPLTVSMQSTQTYNSLGTWNSEVIPITAIVNNSSSGITQPVLVTLPNVNWDPYVTGGNSISVQLTGLTIKNPDGTLNTIPINNIENAVFNTSLLNSNGTILSSNSLYTGNVFSSTLANALTATELQISLTSDIVANNSLVYPTNQNTAFYFTAQQDSTITGLVDENGPWTGGYAPAASNSNYVFGQYTLTLSDFIVPDFTFPSDGLIQTIITGINVTNIGDDAVTLWLDTNTVTQNPDGTFGPFTLYVKLNTEVAPEWNPVIHGGTYYEGNQESYFFVNPQTVFFNATANYGILPSPVQQGAPILGFIGATPNVNSAIRQVNFFNWAATPNSLSLTNTEIVLGNYTNTLYASYPNITHIQVYDVTDINNVIAVNIASTTSADNTIEVVSPSSVTIGNQYQLQYQVANSFYVDNNYQGPIPPTISGSVITSPSDYTQQPQGVVVYNTSTPTTFVYENSTFQSSTPVPLALSPFYTPIEEGFIFLSNQDYEFSYALIYLSTQNILQNVDFLVANIYSFDIYGNPKPNIEFTANLTYCYFGFAPATPSQTTTFTTDAYGRAILTINAFGVNSVNSMPLQDNLTITQTNNSNYSLSQSFTVNPPITTPKYILKVNAAQESIVSNAANTQLVYGLVTDAYYNPIPDATVNWVKGRTNFDMFSANGVPGAKGVVTTNSSGNFVIGPFYSSVVPGYWLMAATLQNATPSAGDVAFWLEYPDTAAGTGILTGLPDQIIQLATPTYSIPRYNAGWQHPLYYNGIEPISSTPSSINWIPPSWFPLPVFDQWEYNLFAATPQTTNPEDWANYVYKSLPPNVNYEF